MENFLIIRLSSLGDIIHTLPAFAALRKNFPQARISWAVEPKGKEILDLVPGIDEIVVVGTPGCRKRIQNKNQTAIDFQGLIKSGLIARLSRSRKRIGFHRKNLKEPLASVFYTNRLEEVSEAHHVIQKNMRLLQLMGIQEENYEFPLIISDEILHAAKEKIKKLGYRGGPKLILFNVGAAWPTKRWFPKHWIAVLKALRNEDIFPLLVWGTPEEQQLAEHIHQESHAAVAPFLAVQEILALIKLASLLVSGDTFALQAACALGVPTVGIFGPTNPKRNGPFRPSDKIAYHEIICSLCYKRSCDSLECMKLITPQEVLSLIRQAIKENA
jgi:lipopolysaccharide heptosyltransferase I